MEDIDVLLSALDRRGPSGEERRAQAQARIRYWTDKRDGARASKNHAEEKDAESKIAYWEAKLRGLEARMRAQP